MVGFIQSGVVVLFRFAPEDYATAVQTSWMWKVLGTEGEVGTASQGITVEEALANLKEATEVYLEEFPQHAPSHPIIRQAGVTVEEFSHAHRS